MDVNIDILNQSSTTIDHIVVQVSPRLDYIRVSYRTAEDRDAHVDELEDYGIELTDTADDGPFYQYIATYYIGDKYE